MKRFWKKVNRGLLLGGALLLGLIVMIVIREVRFQKEVPEIEEVATSYIEEMVKLNLAPEGLRVGESLTQAQLDAKLQALAQLESDYWFREAVGDNVRTLSFFEIKKGFEDYWSQERSWVLEEVVFSFSKSNIEVVQSGPDYAKVQFFSNTVSAVVKSYSDYGFPLYLGQQQYYVDTEVIPSQPLDPEDPDYNSGATLFTYDCMFYINCTVELKRVDGQWRVVSFSGNGDIYGSPVEKHSKGGGEQ